MAGNIILGLCLLAGLAAAEDSSAPATIAHIDFTTPISEAPAPVGLLGEQADNLRGVIERIEKGAADPAIRGLWIDLGGAPIGWGKIHELRQAISKFRQSGKPVWANLEEADTPAYLVALAADQVNLAPAGWLPLTGVRMEVSHYKRLLETVGVQFDFVQVGDYKGAQEPFTRTTMSQPLREQLTLVLDDLYAQVVELVGQGRTLNREQVVARIDAGPYTAAAALENKLVDSIAYRRELLERIKEKLDTDKLVVKMNYGMRDVAAEFDGLAGLMKMFSSMSSPSRGTTSGKRPALALIYAVGPIATGFSQSGLFGESMGSSTIAKAIREAADNDKVAAIVLRVDSPGGSALASDIIWRELQDAGKPIVVSMGDTAASGGYYIAMGADKIFAEPGTLTGSIGVVGGKIALRGLFDKIGVDTEVLSRGANANILSADQPFTDSERAAFERLLDETYKQFTRKVAQGRAMSAEQIAAVAGGRIWTGRLAKQQGLVDELGTLSDAVAEARKLGKIAADAEIDVLVLPKAPSIFEALLGSGAERKPYDASALLELSPISELSEAPRRILGQLRTLVREPVLLIPPAAITIR